MSFSGVGHGKITAQSPENLYKPSFHWGFDVFLVVYGLSIGVIMLMIWGVVLSRRGCYFGVGVSIYTLWCMVLIGQI